MILLRHSLLGHHQTTTLHLYPLIFSYFFLFLFQKFSFSGVMHFNPFQIFLDSTGWSFNCPFLHWSSKIYLCWFHTFIIFLFTFLLLYFPPRFSVSDRSSDIYLGCGIQFHFFSTSLKGYTLKNDRFGGVELNQIFFWLLGYYHFDVASSYFLQFFSLECMKLRVDQQCPSVFVFICSDYVIRMAAYFTSCRDVIYNYQAIVVDAFSLDT